MELLTTLPIESSDAVRQIVAWYCERWGIEVYFRTLKSGCRIEERQFEFLDRELNFIAVSLIHAWRILLRCRLGRECPDMPCDVVFHASEWKAMCMVRTRTEAPDLPPSLNDMIRWIAAMGGHVIRSTTKAKHPGTRTLWLGLQRVNDLAIAWNSYGSKKITPTQKSLIPKKDVWFDDGMLLAPTALCARLPSDMECSHGNGMASAYTVCVESSRIVRIRMPSTESHRILKHPATKKTLTLPRAKHRHLFVGFTHGGIQNI